MKKIECAVCHKLRVPSGNTCLGCRKEICARHMQYDGYCDPCHAALVVAGNLEEGRKKR